MTKRYRVFKIDNMYGVSDDIANYTLAWDTSKTIMDGLCDKLNEQDQRILELESDSQWDDERLESIEGLLLEYESELPPNLLKEFYEIKEGTRDVDD